MTLINADFATVLRLQHDRSEFWQITLKLGEVGLEDL